MWYESFDLFMFLAAMLIIVGIIGYNWINIYTANKYQGKSLFSLEVKEGKNK